MIRVRFYVTAGGRSPVEEFMDSLPPQVRREMVEAISLLDFGRVLSLPLSRNLSSVAPGLHELRFWDSAGQVRVIYFVKERGAVYLLHAFRKRTRIIPRRELQLIRKRLKEI